MNSQVGLQRAHVVVHNRGQKEVHLLSAKPLTMGRAPENDISLSDPRISRFHIRIEGGPQGFRVFDVGSQNGTLCNGRRVRNASLSSGDVIKIGAVRVVFGLGDPAQDDQPHAQTTVCESREPSEVEPAEGKWTGERLITRIGDITKSLNKAPSAEGVFRLIIDAAVEITGSERGFLIKGGKEGMKFAAARNLGNEDLEKPEFQLSWSIAIKVGTSGEGVLAVNAGQDDRFRSLESVEQLGLRSVLCVPINGSQGIMGVIYVDNPLKDGAYTTEDKTVLETLADQAGIALGNRRLVDELEHRAREIEQLNSRLEQKVQEKDSEIERIRADRPREALAWKDFQVLIGGSARMEELRHLLRKVAVTDFPVLVQGESGTGKELVARSIHENSGRISRPFISINCAAIPEPLLESELFGHHKGAFTGADRNRPGLFQAADTGTLFMDEVSEMSTAMQSRLLRVLQEGEVRPVGGKGPVPVDVRVVAASNRDLARLVEKGEFRQDLFYRLKVLPVQVPPLRQRREDIPDLVSWFFKAHNDGLVPGIAPEAMDVLSSYAWPGNVRELENEVKRLAVLAGDTIERTSLSRQILAAGEMLVGRDSSFQDLNELVESIETREIEKALQRTSGNKTKAAGLLGISRFTLQRKLEKYGIAGEVD